MPEEMQSISFPVPTSLRDTMVKAMEDKGVEATNQRIINALKFAFTDNPIPFSDSPSDEPQWASKEDVDNLMDYIDQQTQTLLQHIEVLKEDMQSSIRMATL